MKIKTKITFDIILFLGFFNFFSRGTNILLLGFLFLLLMRSSQGINLSGISLLLLAFVFCDVMYTAVANNAFSIRSLIYPTTVLLAFQAGCYVIGSDKSGGQFEKYYYLIALATATHGIANMVLNLMRYGTDFGGVRVLADLWKPEDTLATGQGALFVLLIGASYYIYSTAAKQTRGILKLVLLIFPVLSVVYNVMTATRFTVYLFFITIVVFYVCDALFVQKKFRKVVVGLCVFLCVFGVLRFNLFGVTDFLEDTALYQRIAHLEEENLDTSLSSRGRELQIAYVINHLPKFAFGGDPMGWGFVHNTWLSVLNRGGVVVAVPFLLLTVAAIGVCLKFAKNVGKRMMYLAVGFLAAVYTYCFIEPMFEGAKWLFIAFVFILGMMQRVTENNRKRGI